MHSLKDELVYFFSGKGMPYAKISIIVAVTVALLFSTIVSETYIKKGKVAIIDLDNSAFSREFIEKINATHYMKVEAVFNIPADPKKLLYQDRYLAVIYLPVDFEKNRYSDSANNIGVFYDNTNVGQSAGIRTGLSALVAMENHEIGSPRIEELGLSSDQSTAAMNNISLKERLMFNPTGSLVHTIAMSILFFFTAMFFAFATLGMIARLRLEGKWNELLMTGTPFDLMLRLTPYCLCLTVSIILGLSVLTTIGNLTFAGNFVFLLLSLLLNAVSLGFMSLLVGWGAGHPASAGSRMIFFVPAGFILGGATIPLGVVPSWLLAVSNVFPLVWTNRLLRDIILRGASFMDIAREFGGFMIYIGILAVLLCFRFYRERQALLIHNHSVIEQG